MPDIFLCLSSNKRAPTVAAAEPLTGRLIVDPYSGCGAFNRVLLKITEKEHCHGRL